MMLYFMGDVTLKEPLTYETIGAMSGVISKVADYYNEDGAIGYTFKYFLEGLNQEENVGFPIIRGWAIYYRRNRILSDELNLCQSIKY